MTTTEAPRDRMPPSARKCEYCGAIEQPADTTWQQWQCPCCGSWNDKPHIATPTARLEEERNRLNNSFGQGPVIDGLLRDRIAAIDVELAQRTTQ